MGVEVVVAGATPAELTAVRSLFAGWDGVFSRFRPESELSRVNRSASPAVAVSPLFARAVAAALQAAAATEGLVDPTLGAALEAAGYDRDFSLIRPVDAPPGLAARGNWRAVRLTGRLLWRPPGVRLDLNGIVKALAVDEALRLIPGPGFVAAGGDLATRGPTTVGLPGGGSIRLLGGGLATSGTTRRHWRRGGLLQHHLLDPRTGRPSDSRWTEVTVGAGSCVAADVAAKAAFLLSGDGPDWLDERGLPGRFADREGIVVNAAWTAATAADEEPVGAAA
jgi:thiamine biosynthesis lipoprotein